MTIKIFIVLILLGNYFYCNSQTFSETSNTYKSSLLELQTDIDLLLESNDLKNANIGIYIQDLTTGAVLYKLNHERNFIPASVNKLITTAAALDILGENFRFSTKIYLDGTILPNGEYNGNIVIRGLGDPTLNQYFYTNPNFIFDKFIDALDSLGIKSIKGNIIGDDSYFDNQYYGQGWAWDDMMYPFSAQVNAISFMDNKVDIIVEQGDSISAITKYKLNPDNNYVRVINNVKTVQKADVKEIASYRDAVTNVIYLEGGLSFDSLKKETSVISVAVDNPTLFFLNLFKDRIVKSKIKFRGALLDIDDLNDKLYYYKYRLVSQVYSPELKLIVNDVNKNSNNLSSEILLKAIGKESVGIGSTKEGIKQVQKYLKRMGISSDNIVYVDGSGLSRQNLISPLNLVRLFSEIQKMPYKDLFLNSMAQPNKDGTLKRRMTKSLAENSLYAKTGSMENVSTIAGIVKAKDKPPIGLAILINNFTVPLNLVRNIQDLICMRISAFSTNP